MNRFTKLQFWSWGHYGFVFVSFDCLFFLSFSLVCFMVLFLLHSFVCFHFIMFVSLFCFCFIRLFVCFHFVMFVSLLCFCFIGLFVFILFRLFVYFVLCRWHLKFKQILSAATTLMEFLIKSGSERKRKTDCVDEKS
jgi:hypothetical protein